MVSSQVYAQSRRATHVYSGDGLYRKFQPRLDSRRTQRAHHRGPLACLATSLGISSSRSGTCGEFVMFHLVRVTNQRELHHSFPRNCRSRNEETLNGLLYCHLRKTLFSQLR